VGGFGGERFSLVAGDKNIAKPLINGWITLDQVRLVFESAGQDFDVLKKQAASLNSQPVTEKGSVATTRKTIITSPLTSLGRIGI